MTKHKSFKRLVRTRMEKTGESYTAARASLLAAEEPKASRERVLATSDHAIRARTGRGWEEWFDLLDEWGAPERSHREIARRIAELQGIRPLAWNAQAVATSYERARGLRAVGDHPEGFTITAQRTVAVPVERLYDAFVGEALRERWLLEGLLRERTATRPKSARFDWGDGKSLVHVTFLAKGDDRSTAAVAHTRVVDAKERERMKAWWRARLNTLRSQLEGGEDDA
jgi:uncharacterized protein YndB with AHSA1/START domain